MRNSGFGMEQVRKIVCNGIKGYESKRRRCLKNGWKLHRTSTMSQGARMRKKLLAKSSWFRRSKKGSKEEETHSMGGKKKKYKSREQKHGSNVKAKSVLFLEQSPDGSLAKMMREVLRAMEPALGFRVKVVERTGQSLGIKFSQSSLWGSTACGREKCMYPGS